MRTFWPMKSDVELTFGSSSSESRDETPVAREMTPNVSPARTRQ